MTTKRDAIRQVLIFTLVLNLLVAVVKIALGLISG
ncbi:MAG: cation-efflux pump, partial [Chloroflexi bacterium]